MLSHRVRYNKNCTQGKKSTLTRDTIFHFAIQSQHSEVRYKHTGRITKQKNDQSTMHCYVFKIIYIYIHTHKHISCCETDIKWEKSINYSETVICAFPLIAGSKDIDPLAWH